MLLGFDRCCATKIANWFIEQLLEQGGHYCPLPPMETKTNKPENGQRGGLLTEYPFPFLLLPILKCTYYVYTQWEFIWKKCAFLFSKSFLETIIFVFIFAKCVSAALSGYYRHCQLLDIESVWNENKKYHSTPIVLY